MTTSEQHLPQFTRSTRWRLVFWTCVAFAAVLGTFVLPFLFPLKVPVFSPVYTAGGNNRVGALAAAVVSVVTTLLCWRFRLFLSPSNQTTEERGTVPAKWLWFGAAAASLSALVLGILMVRQHMYYADAGYFLTQLRSGLVFHFRLYQGFEFAYGPLLYYWPALFIKALGAAHVSVAAAYVVSLCVMEVVGTAMLFFSINALPMGSTSKTVTFLLLCLITLDPQEGLNYTAFRFIFSVAGLVLLSRQKTLLRVCIAGPVLAMLSFSVSPEVGIAFTAGAVAYGCHRAFRDGWRWLWMLLPLLAGCVVFVRVVGDAYFKTLRDFASGGYSMLLEPAPHIYFLLFCAVALAPVVVAGALIRTDAAHRGTNHSLLVALYVTGLTMLPAALGRCDPLHVSFNGWPLFLLSAIALDRMGRSARRVGFVLALLFCGYAVVQEYALGSGAVRQLVTQQPGRFDTVDVPRLKAAVQGQAVSFPWYPPLQAADELTAAGEYQPLYLCIPAVDAASEQRTVRDMRRAQYVMVPNTFAPVGENKIYNMGMKYRLRFGYRYKERRSPYFQGRLLMQDIQRNWQRVGNFGSYDLYRQIR